MAGPYLPQRCSAAMEFLRSQCPNLSWPMDSSIKNLCIVYFSGKIKRKEFLNFTFIVILQVVYILMKIYFSLLCHG